jgi:Uma2 family endonuclease
MTMEEYFAFEHGSPIRHEFVAGEAFAMVGESKRHSRVAGNILARCLEASREGPCRAFMSGIKLRLRDRVYYPDVMVACGPELDDEYCEEAPCLLVEVLSRSTRRTDQREKLAAYTTIPSLGTYLLVEQRRRLVDHYRRDAAGHWQRDTLVDEGAIALSCPAITLTLDEIYEGVTLPPPDEALRVREEVPAQYR